MISIAWSAAMSRKVWVVRLVGQETVRSVDAFRVEQADRLDQAVAAEAGVVADGAVDRPRLAVGGLQVDPDLGPERGAVGLGADQLDLQPVAAVAGVLEQGVVGLVARSRAAELDEEVEVAVAVPVGERDAVPLLEVAGAASWW